MRYKIVRSLCNLGLKFLNWGQATFGSESCEDSAWLMKSKKELEELKANAEARLGNAHP